MATYFPKTENEFLKITGVGEQKLKDFGEDFLMVINEHIMNNEVFNEVSSDVLIISEDDFVSKSGKRVFKSKRGKKAKTGKAAKRKKVSSKSMNWGGKGTQRMFCSVLV